MLIYRNCCHRIESNLKLQQSSKQELKVFLKDSESILDSYRTLF